MMRKPIISVSLGSGQEGWLSIELDSLRFVLEIENGKRTVETLSLGELKSRLPRISCLVAELMAEAIRTRPAGQE
jgi:hypothetical protein